MTRTITDDEFITAVRAVLDERGDEFVYQRDDDAGYACRYSRNGTTGSCLFGAALIEHLGVEYSEDWEGTPILALIRHGGQIAGVRFDLTPDAVRAAHEAQTTQDNGAPYQDVRFAFEHPLSLPRFGTKG